MMLTTHRSCEDLMSYYIYLNDIYVYIYVYFE